MMNDVIQIWFLISSYTQVWPAHDGGRLHDQQGSTIESVYADDGQCLRALRLLRLPAVIPTTVGPVRQIHVTKRCVQSQAKLAW